MVFGRLIQCAKEAPPAFNIALPSHSFKATEWRPFNPGTHLIIKRPIWIPSLKRRAARSHGSGLVRFPKLAL